MINWAAVKAVCQEFLDEYYYGIVQCIIFIWSLLILIALAIFCITYDMIYLILALAIPIPFFIIYWIWRCCHYFKQRYDFWNKKIG